MAEDGEVEARQVYLIQTDGPGGLENTEVVITDLGEIGENAIVVFEEAVGVGAEEIVCGQDQEFVTFSDQENEILLENPANVFPDCDTLKIEQDFNGVHYEADEVTYESVEDVHLTDPNSVYFNVGLESESETSEVLSLPGSSEEVLRKPSPYNKKVKIIVTAFDRAASQPGEKGQKTEAKCHRGQF